MGEDVRQALVDCGRRIVERGLAIGPGGNISARFENTFFIIPHHCALDELTPDGMAQVSLPEGHVLTEGKLPSEEALIHIGLYRIREDVGAIVHIHSPMVIAAASIGIEIRAMFPDFVLHLGTSIPMVDYIAPTTPQLTAAVCDIMEGSDSVILKNHGAVTVGQTLRDAFYRAIMLEKSAWMQMAALALGKPRFITEAEAHEIFAYHTDTHLQEILKRMQQSRT